ncbi:hypothetical protein [Mariniplasma anaerobium]|uniref:Lipoprotein n=1 Tax=Mariniplasma anaerobium TaxID=2735436 RepID=A0A7U9TIF4_9MOLU|nr:hypothetical protein [Mariniplasma anaerobium]BCR36000.1 hypothetical protein MPAN_008930 [Mariniplasma anaerobium]
MKKLVTVLAVLVMGLLLVSCGPKEATATGYGIAHQIYVGEVELTIDADGVVTAAAIEEYYLPFNAAVIETPAEGATDVVLGNSHGVKSFAKYFKVGDVLFTATEGAREDDVVVGMPTYAAADGTDLLDWVAIEANAKLYVEGTQDGTVFIANADGTKHATYPTPEGDQWTKSGTGYGGDRWDWAGQMAEITSVLVGSKVSATYTMNDDGMWVVDTVVSGATLVDFDQYYKVAMRAYANAKAQQ